MPCGVAGWGLLDHMELAFADCVLNLDSRQLFRAGMPVPLEPKAFQLLEVLAKRRPAVVTYIELDELLWPQAYVARTSLARIVSELRTRLGDAPQDSRIIRTVYKTGYSFAADVVMPVPASRAAAGWLLRFNGRTLALVAGDNIAGREPDCAICVDATTVSRRHARITVALGIATVDDLGSTNGTFINGVAVIAPTALKEGDEIALGKAVLTLHAVPGPAATEMITRDGPAVAPVRAGVKP